MILRFHGLALPHDAEIHKGIKRYLDDRLGAFLGGMRSYRIVRRSIDARGSSVKLIFSVDVDIEIPDGAPSVIEGAFAPPPHQPLVVRPGSAPMKDPPVVVGAGPSGLFAAYLLAKNGYRPIIIDRGGTVEERLRGIEKFARTRTPDPARNALFGVGGAGTFSDGKLTTTLKHPWLEMVLSILVDCGAPEEITIDAKPHIGTDLLGSVVSAMVKKIEEAGGRLLTDHCLVDLTVKNGALVSATITGKGYSNDRLEMETQHLVLAIGHSARDTWKMIESRGIELSPKKFQMGIRVEHPQTWVNSTQYGVAAGHPALGAAEYKLTTRADGIPVFTFCMCPGGETMATVNEQGQLCLNGMSRSARDSAFSSSGVVTTIDPVAEGATRVVDSIKLAIDLEMLCFSLGGGDYRAPAQRLIDFVRGQRSSRSLPLTSYRLGCKSARLDEALPRYISAPLRSGIADFHKRMPGYLHPEAVALAPEARASSPVRIVRNSETRESITVRGIYPSGEGSGYSGGIMSSALDGLNSAAAIIKNSGPPSQ